MVIVLLGVLAAVAIPVIGNLISSAKQTTTKDEMRMLGRALAGSSTTSDRGFEGDVGYLPSALSDLVTKPDSIAAWNAFTHVGWHGPYVDSTGGLYLKDSWGTAYAYSRTNRTLQSTGSGQTITVTF